MKKILIILFAGFLFSCSHGGSDKSKQVDNDPVFVKDTIYIRGMHCDMCVNSIEKGVGEVEGVKSVHASLIDSMAIVQYDNSKTNLDKIKSAVEGRGYSVKNDF